MSIPIAVFLLFGLGIPLFAFLSGLYYIKKNKKSENRINRVVMQTIDGPRDAASLLHRLSMSSILDLEGSKEIVEACDRVKKEVGKNPIPDNCGLSSDDLKDFFTYVSVNKIDLRNTSIQEVTKNYKNKMTLNVAA
ncbi:MAG: hypothetical protein ABGX83_08205 [Nitrospira sp.]|nr:hypothetical protein [Candidatus Manganitrophaceae bacterium]HIL34166.1 hypothetical protein [Candidatus Manganitrophaceae bacterium]